MEGAVVLVGLLAALLKARRGLALARSGAPFGAGVAWVQGGLTTARNALIAAAVLGLARALLR